MRRIILLNAALFAALQLYSQNLNPQVQVTNDYQTRMADVSKLELQMQVPDSLGEFATDVDYSVFQTDYKGAYEFNPYAIKVTPKAGDYSGRRLYLRAGAGFSFHPVLNAVYTPVRKGLHRMNFYNEFNGYAGRYHQAVGDSFNGYDYSERLGAEGRLNDEDFDLRWNAAWKGNFNKDSFTRSIYNGVNLSTNISSNSDTTLLYYNFSMKAGFATDRFSNGALGRVNEFSYIVDGTIGPEIYQHMIRLLIDIHTQNSVYNTAFSEPLNLSYLRPRAVFDWGPLNVSAGVSLCTGGKGLGLYPDVQASLMLWKDVLNVYGGFGGGQFAENYSALKERDSWVNSGYLHNFKSTVEQFHFDLGLRGSAASKFEYDLHGGFVSYARAAVDMIGPSIDSTAIVGKMAYRDYKVWFFDTNLAWRSERFDADASMSVRKTSIGDDKTFLDLPLFSASLTALYNWDRRIYGGMRVKGATARYSSAYEVKGFVDLGFYGEYRFNNKLSAWGQLGNLLCKDVPLSPMHAQHGMHFTAGITLRLQ